MSAPGPGELAEVGGELAEAGPSAPEAQVPPAVPVRRPTSLLRVGALAVLAVIAGVAGWLLLQRGITTDDFPPFLADQQHTTITRYSGPWLTAAAGAVLIAGLLLLTAAFDLVRWNRQKASSRSTVES